MFVYNGVEFYCDGMYKEWSVVKLDLDSIPTTLSYDEFNLVINLLLQPCAVDIATKYYQQVLAILDRLNTYTLDRISSTLELQGQENFYNAIRKAEILGTYKIAALVNHYRHLGYPKNKPEIVNYRSRSNTWRFLCTDGDVIVTKTHPLLRNSGLIRDIVATLDPNTGIETPFTKLQLSAALDSCKTYDYTLAMEDVLRWLTIDHDTLCTYIGKLKFHNVKTYTAGSIAHPLEHLRKIKSSEGTVVVGNAVIEFPNGYRYAYCRSCSIGFDHYSNADDPMQPLVVYRNSKPYLSLDLVEKFYKPI